MRMTQSAFDATGFFRFDLANGSIKSREGEQLALIPVDLLDGLEPGEQTKRSSMAFGKTHGKRFAEIIAQLEEPPGVEILADHLGGLTAVFGLGRSAVEIRGNAILFRLKSGREMSDGVVTLLTGFLAGFMSEIEPETTFEILHMQTDDDGDLFWAGNPKAINQVKDWLADGVKPMEALWLLSEEGR